MISASFGCFRPFLALNFGQIGQILIILLRYKNYIACCMLFIHLFTYPVILLLLLPWAKVQPLSSPWDSLWKFLKIFKVQKRHFWFQIFAILGFWKAGFFESRRHAEFLLRFKKRGRIYRLESWSKILRKIRKFLKFHQNSIKNSLF